MAEVRQVYPHACPNCGSMYRVGDHCNKCNVLAPAPDHKQDRQGIHNFTGGKAPRGRIWDSKLHRYVG